MMRSPARICTTAQDRSLAVAPGGGVLFPPAVSALSLGGAASSMVRSIPDFIESGQICACDNCNYRGLGCTKHFHGRLRSEEHTSELQSLMRISYAVFCLKKKKHTN